MSGIGETLRRAREQRGISRDDLARSLRLERRILICLENDELDQLAAPAFVRGYVRSLCKELAIDSAPLLEYLDGRFAGAVPALADFSSRAPVQITGQSDIVRYTTAIVALVMVVLVVLWWQSHEQAAPLIDQSEIEKPIVVPADTPPLAYEFPLVIHPHDPFYRAEEEPVVHSTDGVAIGPGTPEAITPKSEEIVISAEEDSWIQVMDASGELLYYNVVRGGSQIEIAGRRPYSLVIGNAAAVRVSFEGNAIDLESLSERGVARFRLGAD